MESIADFIARKAIERITRMPVEDVVDKIYRATNLHNELASLYMTKSNDRKRINMLWDAIEDVEGQLGEMGVFL